MRTRTVKEIAGLIADKLFSNHFGDKADRLVLMYERPPHSKEVPRNLGGYCRASVIAIIEAEIRESKD